ncbi:DNA topoisomerase 1 [Acanthamoeba polyphaga moumouvirus]|uniref:DNA topoisomerase n=1 Tax=Acanthamoeba polyphaga moumouvirus TaxID=1269028 RepID=L7RC17_9VIRU|nr:DNA topoisomerase 1 [Acanthamoeba polyphaga moumouvirus]AGC01792.1 DNA topoisomerase 1 [Acanthamoeba polyphaga moumouvirus]
MSILVIVESPNKISKISNFLGKNYIVKASVGHFRDLDPKKMSIDFDNKFEPIYVVLKPDVVKNLKSNLNKIDTVYIAADPDREGEAIAQSLYDVLKPKKYRRLRFNAITRQAILEAIKNAGTIEKNLVNAQKARRVLDRLFGYLISPILQKQIGGKLSAGRVQSVTVRIAIDKENEIKNFLEKNSDSSFFKVTGKLSKLKSVLYISQDKTPHTLKTAYKGTIAHINLIDSEEPHKNVTKLLNNCLKSEFYVHSVNEKIATRSPSPPFTTSTLQQEANRKFGMSIDTTMKTAQKLYEGGFITYIRTDSVEISEEGHKDIKKIIEKEYGKEYYQRNNYKNKVANSQEAHECIRPTHPDLITIDSEIEDAYQIKLYKLIWQRTIASQMPPAKIKIITLQITISKYLEKKLNPYYYFQSQIETVIFPGYMKVYTESYDDVIEDENKNKTENIPKVGDKLIMEEIIARQEYLRPPPRYSEASLVKKLEELGIGRPCTYVNTIKTILNREYIKIGDVPGIKKEITTYTIKSKNKKHIMEILEDNSHILLGKENKKIIPTNLGMNVNNYLLDNFGEFLDYKFTANMESELDEIAAGNKVWHKIIQSFYDKLKPIVDNLSTKNNILQSNEKLLGVDKNGCEIFATKTKFGPVVKKKSGDKFIYSKIPDNLSLDTIKLKDAIKLLVYPKKLGTYKSGDVFLQKGSYGLYIHYKNQNYSIGEINEKDIDINSAIKLIESRHANNIAEFEIKKGKNIISAIVLKGPYGYYIQTHNGNTRKNYPIPKNIDPQKINLDQVKEIISQSKKYTNSKSKTQNKVNTGSKKNSKANSKK